MKISKKKFLFLLFSFLLLNIPIFSQEKFADLVIINANVRTMDAGTPRAEAVAVSGNKIIAVGTNAQIRPLIGASTKTIDARGKLVIPGFNDSHVHFTGIGNQFSTIDLRGAKSLQEVAEKIKHYARFLPKGRWILGGQWNHENWTPSTLPTRELIDSVSPNNPVFIYHVNPKMALANRLALKLAGINEWKQVKNGTIVRDADGNATGLLKDDAINLVQRVIPPSPTKNWLEVAETATNYAASLGVTSVQDVHSDDIFEVLQELLRQDKLKTRVYDCISLSNWQKLSDAKIRRADGDSLVRRGCLKSFSDGDEESAIQLQSDILAADKANLQIMMHAIGNTPNDAVLKIFEQVVQENGTKDRRFRVEHAHNLRPEDIKRFGDGKIIASMQPHLFPGGTRNGTEPYRALLDTKAMLAFGSDASITDFNPLFGIYAAVAGENTNASNQAISVEEAVRAYTLGSAFAEFQDDVKGTITVGKLADFVILSDDIFSIKPEKINETKVLTTIMDGKVVYESK